MFIGPCHGQIPSTERFDFYYSKASTATLSERTRKQFLRKAGDYALQIPHDSLKYLSLSKTAVLADKFQDSLLFKKMAKASLKVAADMQNGYFLADGHWNYGAYYFGREKHDSSYIHYNAAAQIFESLGHSYYTGKMQYNMALISSKRKDYTGAEIQLIHAIELFEKEKSAKQLYLCYNLLGTLAENLEEYEKALSHYSRAKNLIPKIETNYYEREENLNNLGLIYQKMENYTKAIQVFEEGLQEQELKKARLPLYTKLLDNWAYSRFLEDSTASVGPYFLEALRLRDSIDDTAGAVINRIHLAEYFAKKQDTSTAMEYLEEAYLQGKNSGFNRDILKALEVKAALDKENQSVYLKEYIALAKGLNAKERGIRNKFAAVRFDTEKFKTESERLSQERKYFVVGAVGLLLILALLFLNAQQRARNKKLLLQQEQQQHNEDLYLLALENKITKERGRNEERQRIAEELHDGILPRLFALRFRWSGIQFYDMEKSKKAHEDAVEQLMEIEHATRALSHEMLATTFYKDRSLIEEVEALVTEKNEVEKGRFVFDYDHETAWNELGYVKRINILRILDEILQNVLKHAFATETRVNLTGKEDELLMQVSDNGRGFKTDRSMKGIGLKNLHNRSKKMHGKLTIISAKGKGTTIAIRIPKD